jgi:hypothetical protein
LLLDRDVVAYVGQAGRADRHRLSERPTEHRDKVFDRVLAVEFAERPEVPFRYDLDAAEHAAITLTRPRDNDSMPAWRPDKNGFPRHQHYQLRSVLFRSWLARLRSVLVLPGVLPAHPATLTDRLYALVSVSAGGWVEPGLFEHGGRWHVWWSGARELRVCDKTRAVVLIERGVSVSGSVGGDGDAALLHAWQWAIGLRDDLPPRYWPAAASSVDELDLAAEESSVPAEVVEDVRVSGWREVSPYGWIFQIPQVGYFLLGWFGEDRTLVTVRFHDMRARKRDRPPVVLMATPIDFDLARRLVDGEVSRFVRRAGP